MLKLFRIFILICLIPVLSSCGSDPGGGAVTVQAAAEENIDFSTYPAITVPLYVYRVTDDDGSNAADFTVADVNTHVSAANAILTKANITLTFDSASHLETTNNTAINLYHGYNQTQSGAEQTRALAASNPGFVTVFGRGRPGVAYGGSGNNIIGIQFNEEYHCGVIKYVVFAHEFGHVASLPHTHTKTFSSIEEASSYLAFVSSDPASLDGDGITDTAPDPYIANYDYQCTTDGIITINNITFHVPYKNVMSYYSHNGVTPEFTTGQILKMREDLISKGF